MNEHDTVRDELKSVVIIIGVVGILGFLFVVNEFNNTAKTEESVYQIEFAHMLEANNMSRSGVRQYTGSINAMCGRDFIEVRFATRCIDDLIRIRNGG